MTNTTKAQHTPGPWRISECQLGNKLLIEHGEDTILSPIIGSVYSDEGRLSQMANARLIAAAPDLLAAAKAALTFIESLPYTPSNSAETRLQDRLFDAIARAEGNAE